MFFLILIGANIGWNIFLVFLDENLKNTGLKYPYYFLIPKPIYNIAIKYFWCFTFSIVIYVCIAELSPVVANVLNLLEYKEPAALTAPAQPLNPIDPQLEIEPQTSKEPIKPDEHDKEIRIITTKFIIAVIICFLIYIVVPKN